MLRKPTLVIGATGKTGRRVTERLKARNLPVRIGSRSGQPPFDWTDPATWPPESGVEHTLLRASLFARNFSESFLLDPILAGEVALPVGNVAEPFIHADDIADAATMALTEDRHVGQLYELTGPRLWTFAQAIAEIARLTNRSIRYIQISLEEYAAAMKAMQVPPEFISFITYLFTEVLDGRNASVADGVTHPLGRPPRDFADYVRETAATGVWKAGLQS